MGYVSFLEQNAHRKMYQVQYSTILPVVARDIARYAYVETSRVFPRLSHGKQCMWIAKSTILLVGQQPNPLDRTQSVRLACSLLSNTNEQMLHDTIMQKRVWGAPQQAKRLCGHKDTACNEYITCPPAS